MQPNQKLELDTDLIQSDSKVDIFPVAEVDIATRSKSVCCIASKNNNLDFFGLSSFGLHFLVYPIYIILVFIYPCFCLSILNFGLSLFGLPYLCSLFFSLSRCLITHLCDLSICDLSICGFSICCCHFMVCHSWCFIFYYG